MGGGEPHSQSPVDSDDEGDVICGQSYGGEHDDHGDEPGLGDASCPDAGCGGCDATGRGAAGSKRRSRKDREHCWGPGSKEESRILGPRGTAIWGRGF